MAPVIEVRGITKRFPGVLANDDIDLTLEKGDVLALLGENGAGKSTLMNIVYGLYEPDEGQILIDGEPITFRGPTDAISQGIGMVHQHFMLIPVMTVTENIMLGVEETTNSATISTIAAAVFGAVAGFAIGGIFAALYFAILAGVFLLTATNIQLNSRMGIMLFGSLIGFAFGLMFEGISVLLMGTSQSLAYPLLGTFVGMLANLRWIDKSAVRNQIIELSQRYELDVDPDATIRDLTVGAQQRVEIIKALYRDAKILILDEPTAVLTPKEADELFKIMRGLTEQGVSIIFITHKLREVLEVADTIVVLRRGRVVGEADPQQATRESLAEMMVGREVVLQVLKDEANPKDDILRVRDLHVEDDRDQMAVNDVTFTVRAGEIVGIAGVQGNGQTETVEAITGLRKPTSGTINIMGKTIILGDPRAITQMGVAHIPEDRQKHGLVLTYPIADNMILPDYHRQPFSSGILLDEDAIEANAKKLVDQYDVRTPSIYTSAGSLSGGNQQKVIVARELSREPKLIIAAQPTRGLDVGSIEFIHNQMVKARDNGAAVLLVSAELDEVMSLSDRVIVMYQGQIMADLLIEEATRERLGLLMAGVSA